MIRENTSNSGGGISMWASSNPTLTNVTIINNTIDDGGTNTSSGGVKLVVGNPKFIQNVKIHKEL